MIRFSLIAGFLMCAVSVALGAFGTHAIAEHVSAARLDTWHTASRFLTTQGLGLIAVAMASHTFKINLARSAILLFAGACVFSSVLFLLVLLDLPWLGAIAPLGGILMITGWLSAAYTLFKRL